MDRLFIMIGMVIHYRRKEVTEKRIKSVFRFNNGMVAVCDQFGNQMPNYQGRWTDMRESILRDAPEDTEWNGIRPWSIIERDGNTP